MNPLGVWRPTTDLAARTPRACLANTSASSSRLTRSAPSGARRSRKVVTYWNAAPGEEEPDTQARVLAPITKIESDLERGACPDLCRVDRDSTRCTEAARLSIPGGLLRDRRASVLSPHSDGPRRAGAGTPRAGPGHPPPQTTSLEHRFSGNSHRGSLAESRHQWDVVQGHSDVIAVRRRNRNQRTSKPSYCSARIASISAIGSRSTGPRVSTTARSMVQLKRSGAA